MSVEATGAPVFGNHHIIIVGEIHRHVESPKWFLMSTSEYVNKNKCLHIGLEIGSDQQGAINKFLNSEAPVSAIYISSIIDHIDYRNMLSGFKALISDGYCLNVYAIDAPQSINTNRDEWMLKQIKKVDNKSIPWAILIGSLHALQQLNWYQKAHGKPFLAELLQDDGYDVFSIIQNWSKEKCSKRSAKYTSDVRKPLLHLLEPVSAYYPEAPSSTVDAAIIWNCQ